MAFTAAPGRAYTATHTTVCHVVSIAWCCAKAAFGPPERAPAGVYSKGASYGADPTIAGRRLSVLLLSQPNTVCVGQCNGAGPRGRLQCLDAPPPPLMLPLPPFPHHEARHHHRPVQARQACHGLWAAGGACTACTVTRLRRGGCGDGGSMPVGFQSHVSRMSLRPMHILAWSCLILSWPVPGTPFQPSNSTALLYRIYLHSASTRFHSLQHPTHETRRAYGVPATHTA